MSSEKLDNKASTSADVSPPEGGEKENTSSFFERNRDKLIKAAIPLGILFVMLMIPPPGGMEPQSWRFLALFITMIVGMILEPIPATAISLICLVTAIALGEKVLLFSEEERAKKGFNALKAPLKWGLEPFSSPTVWIIFAAFTFALGYEVTGLGRRIALLIIRAMGKNSLLLGYGIVVIDVLLGPFTPSNTARTGGTVFPVIQNLPPLFKSYPNDKSSRDIGGYLMWMMIIGTSISSMLFLTAAAPNGLGANLVSQNFPDISITWTNWFLAALPVGIILLVVSPWLAYVLYKPRITHSPEIPKWAKKELDSMGKLKTNEIILLILVILSVFGWVVGKNHINATVVALIAVALMLVFGVVKWEEITKYKAAWNTLVNLATLVAMADGLSQSGFIKWFSGAVESKVSGLSATMAFVVLLLLFYFSHYLFASLTAHATTMLPMILAVAAVHPSLNISQFTLLLLISMGLMCVLTPYATGPGVIIYATGYIKSADYWRLGAIFGVFFIAVLMCVGWPIMAMWM